jgi:nicotinamidase-related amidase
MEVQNKALLVMDVQPGIVDRLKDKEAYLARLSVAVALAHAHHIQVIYVVVGFRPGFPEASSRNKVFQGILKTGASHLINPQPVIPPSGGDLVVIKRRVSAFAGSDLEVILRASEITHLVLSGISTSGVVLSTIREAADKDYELTVLSDLCADVDEQVHTLLLEKIFPRQANVIGSGEWNLEVAR